MAHLGFVPLQVVFEKLKLRIPKVGMSQLDESKWWRDAGAKTPPIRWMGTGESLTARVIRDSRSTRTREGKAGRFAVLPRPIESRTEGGLVNNYPDRKSTNHISLFSLHYISCAGVCQPAVLHRCKDPTILCNDATRASLNLRGAIYLVYKAQFEGWAK